MILARAALSPISEFKQNCGAARNRPKGNEEAQSSHEPVNLEGKLWKMKDPLNGDPWTGHHDNAIRHMLESKTQLKGLRHQGH